MNFFDLKATRCFRCSKRAVENCEVCNTVLFCSSACKKECGNIHGLFCFGQKGKELILVSQSTGSEELMKKGLYFLEKVVTCYRGLVSEERSGKWRQDVRFNSMVKALIRKCRIFDILYNISSYYVQLGLYTTAYRFCKEAIEESRHTRLDSEEKANLRLVRGEICYNMNNFKTCISDFSSLVKYVRAQPDSSLKKNEVLFLSKLGHCYTNIGEESEAYDCLIQVVEIYEKSTKKGSVAELKNFRDAFYMISFTLCNTRNTEKVKESLEHLQKAKRLNEYIFQKVGQLSEFQCEEYEVMIGVVIGKCLFDLSQYREGAEVLRKVLEGTSISTSNLFMSQVYLGQCLINIQEIKDGLEYLEQANQLKESLGQSDESLGFRAGAYSSMLALMAKCYRMYDNSEKEAEYYEKALSIINKDQGFPLDEDTACDVGDYLRRSEKYEEGLKVVNRLLSQNPLHLGSMSVRSSCLMHMGSIDEAISSYTKAIRLQPNPKPDDYMLYHMRGLCYYRKAIRKGDNVFLSSQLVKPQRSLIEKAIVDFTTSLKFQTLDIHHCTSRGITIRSRARCYIKLGELKLALNELLELHKNSLIDDPMTCLMITSLSKDLNMLDLSREFFKKAEDSTNLYLKNGEREAQLMMLKSVGADLFEDYDHERSLDYRSEYRRTISGFMEGVDESKHFLKDGLDNRDGSGAELPNTLLGLSSKIWSIFYKDWRTNEKLEIKQLKETRELFKTVRFSDLNFHRKLGNGAFGSTYLVSIPKFGKLTDVGYFVIKFPHSLSDLDIERQREIMSRDLLSYLPYHRNLVSILSNTDVQEVIKVDRLPDYESFWKDELYVNDEFKGGIMLMKNCKKDLGKYILQRYESGSPFSNLEISRILYGIVSGVKFLHERFIVHRDLHVGNVFVDEQWGRIWVGDFGLALDLGKRDTKLLGFKVHKEREKDMLLNLASSGSIYMKLGGAKDFLAPEITDFDEKGVVEYIDFEHTDIFSVGVIGYYLIQSFFTQKDDEGDIIVGPFGVDGDGQPITKNRKELKSLKGKCDDNIWRLISSMLELEKTKRISLTESQTTLSKLVKKFEEKDGGRSKFSNAEEFINYQMKLQEEGSKLYRDIPYEMDEENTGVNVKIYFPNTRSFFKEEIIDEEEEEGEEEVDDESVDDAFSKMELLFTRRKYKSEKDCLTLPSTPTVAITNNSVTEGEEEEETKLEDSECLIEIKKGKCTRSVTKNTHRYQKFYRCITCFGKEKKGFGVCESCKNLCHLNHNLEFRGILNCYCDCSDIKEKITGEECKLCFVAKKFKDEEEEEEEEEVKKFFVECVTDYDGAKDSSGNKEMFLTLEKGQFVEVFQKSEGGIWFGNILGTDQCGYFNRNVVKEIELC